VGGAVHVSDSESETDQEESSSNAQEDERPGRKEGLDVDDSLLGTVGEVVVASAHVVVGASLLDSDETSVPVSRGRIQLHAVLVVLLGSLSVAVVLFQELLPVQALGGVALVLTEVGHLVSLRRVAEEEGGILGRDGVVVAGVGHLDNVRAVSASLAFSVVVGWVGVASSPLHVDVISGAGIKNLRDKVVFNGRINLHNVASLSSDVEIEDTGGVRNSGGSGANGEDVCSILEGSSGLSGVEGHGVVASHIAKARILDDRGVLLSVERTVDRGAPWVVVSSGNVVTNTKRAVLLNVVGNSPVVPTGIASVGIAEMVVTSFLALEAVGRGDTPSRLAQPLSSTLSARELVVESRNVTEVLCLDVLALSLVKVASLSSVGKDGNILPWSRMPVGVVIALLRALETATTASWILAGVSSSISAGLLVSEEESLISLSPFAVLVVLVAFVHSVNEGGLVLPGERVRSNRVIVGGAIGRVGIIRGSFRVETVSHFISTRVLQDDLAVSVGSIARMLSSPLNGEQRPDVVVHFGAPAVTALGVVLGVHKSVVVVSVLTRFVETVVGKTGVVSINISLNLRQRCEGHDCNHQNGSQHP